MCPLPRLKRLFNALSREDFLGFDTAPDLFDYLFREELPITELSPQVKGALTSYMRSPVKASLPGLEPDNTPAPSQLEFEREQLATSDRAKHEGYRVANDIFQAVLTQTIVADPEYVQEINQFTADQAQGFASFSSTHAEPIVFDPNAPIDLDKGSRAVMLQYRNNTLNQGVKLLNNMILRMEKDKVAAPQVEAVNGLLKQLNAEIEIANQEYARGVYVPSEENGHGTIFNIPNSGDTAEQMLGRERTLTKETKKETIEGAMLRLHEFITEQERTGNTDTYAYTMAVSQRDHLMDMRIANVSEDLAFAEVGRLRLLMMGEAERLRLSGIPEAKEAARVMEKFHRERRRIHGELRSLVNLANRGIREAVKRLDLNTQDIEPFMQTGMQVYEQPKTLAESMMDDTAIRSRRARLALNLYVKSHPAFQETVDKIGEIRALKTLDRLMVDQQAVANALMEGNKERSLHVYDADLGFTRKHLDAGFFTFSGSMSASASMIAADPGLQEAITKLKEAKAGDLPDIYEQLGKGTLNRLFRLAKSHNSRVYRAKVHDPAKGKAFQKPILDLPQTDDPAQFFQGLASKLPPPKKPGDNEIALLKNLVQFHTELTHAYEMSQGLRSTKQGLPGTQATQHSDTEKKEVGPTLVNKVEVQALLSNSRSKRHWPDQARSYQIWKDLKQVDIQANGIAASRAFGVGGDRLNNMLAKAKASAHQASLVYRTLKAEAGYGEGDKVRIGKLLKNPRFVAAAKAEFGDQDWEAKARSLAHRRNYVETIEGTGRRLNDYLSKGTQFAEERGAWRQFFNFIIRGMLENTTSSITLMNEMFPFFNEGVTKQSLSKAWHSSLAAFKYGVSNPLMVTFGMEPNMDKELLGALETLGEDILDADRHRTFADITGRLVSPAHSLPGEGLERVMELMSKPWGAKGGQAGIRPTAPFLHTTEALRKAILVGNIKSMESQVRELIAHWDTHGEASMPEGFYKGVVRQEYLYRFEEVSGFSLEAFARRAKQNLDQGVNLFDKQMYLGLLDWASYQQGETHIGNTPIGMLSGWPGIFSTLYKWNLLRGNLTLRKFYDNEGKSLLKPSEAKAVATKMALMVAPAAISSVGVNWLREWYMEHILWKRRNNRKVTEAFSGGVDDVFLTAVEQLAKSGSLGYLGDILDASVNTAAGGGSPRALSLDSRIVAVSSFQNVMSAVRYMFNTGFDVDYTHVARPVITALGGASMIQTLHTVNNIGVDVFGWEANTARRGHVANTLSVWGRILDLENKQFYGGAKPTAMSKELTNIEFAIYNDDSDGFRRAWKVGLQEAIASGRARTYKEAERYLKASIRSRHPLQKSFRKITNYQYRDMLKRMDPGSRETTKKAVRRWNKYLVAVGSSGFEGTK